MFHRLWTLIRKELQSLLREPQTRMILIMPVLIQVLLFPFAATLEVTNATIAIYNEDSGRHAVELTQRFARAKAFTHVLLLKSPQAIQPTIDEQKALLVVRFGWNGIGFVIQAYQKRCPFVIDYLIDLATRSRRRLMIRLVKGAYWDSEIKRAQMEGLEGYRSRAGLSGADCDHRRPQSPALVCPAAGR